MLRRDECYVRKNVVKIELPKKRKRESVKVQGREEMKKYNIL